ncbi:MAG: FAD-dependent oxidoreductase [Proteobacteria bacterium]|uniref:FAD-dependent oxidoreductase n=1 Tax=Aquabacterium sp. TaxID=1872578 RepID=UPI0035C6BB49|nr:FAD-dependent oxidoreductase [Pseudomonadota bacterium]
MSTLRIGIAGAGLLGRLLAWHFSRQGHEVHVYDPAPHARPAHDGHGAAGFTAAGMLSPLAELETAEPALAALGWQSIAHWRAIAQCLAEGLPGASPTAPNVAPHFAQNGSLLVAHGADLGAARRMLAHLDRPSELQAAGFPAEAQAQALDTAALAALEPDLHGSNGPLQAWLLPGEGHIDTVATMQALHDDAVGVRWHWAQAVRELSPGAVWLSQSTVPQPFDLVCDVRGVGARPTLPVRGVRGEVVWLHAPGVRLQRPVRLLHPRHRVYIVPRPGERVLVGASELETEDRDPMTLRSAVELMAAAHSILPALAEARILRLDTNLRPALPDHRPHLHTEAGLLRLNGLYRHGWLLGPALVQQALQALGLAALPCAGAAAASGAATT